MNVRGDKALVVDDDPDVLALAIEVFRLLGYEVLSASTGEAAIKLLMGNPDIDVLFSDIVMPGMNGIALGEEARKLVPGIRVLLTSGYPAPALTAGSANLRNFDFIRKPYRIAEITRALRKIG